MPINNFGGSNAGLVLAEVELGRADEAFARPGLVRRLPTTRAIAIRRLQ
jgi:CYTH domain-containing protein